MTGIIIIVGIYIAAIVAINRRYRPPEQVATPDLTDRLSRIETLREQIAAVQELLTDIDLSSGTYLKCITLDWETAAEHSLTVDIWLDGASDSTKIMRALAQARLAELSEQLYDEIGKLPYRHRQNALRKAVRHVDKTFSAGGGGDRA